jgi:quercetin dioxygenase-like cupin family protein
MARNDDPLAEEMQLRASRRRSSAMNVSLNALAREHPEIAARLPSGRSSHTVVGGQGHVLHQTLIALQAGHVLGEHANPREATLYVLTRRVRLVAGGDSWGGAAGHLIAIPDRRHSLEAVEDSVVLLTSVNTRR